MLTPLTQKAVESKAELRRLDLRCIARAHGRYTPAEKDARLHEVHAAIVFVAVRMKVAERKVDVRNELGPVVALVREIVDREHCLR